ncbi:MAG: HAD-IA family hydrolase [Lachnospiraceae bacterium]|nr:HAD-IA family hydrolase [Lachnospiraceae bacterium]
MAFDGIILDVDGTLWDSRGVVTDSWNRAAREEGLDIRVTPEILGTLFGKTMDEIAEALMPDAKKEDRDRILKRSIQYEDEDLANNAEDITYNGVIETLYTLHDMGAKLAIVSNCQVGYIELFMEKTGVEHLICDTECFGNTGQGKADNIRAVVERNGFKNPVYVGDTEGDMIASREAGVPFAWAEYGFGESQPEGSIAAFSSPYDMIGLMRLNAAEKLIYRIYSVEGTAERLRDEAAQRQVAYMEAVTRLAQQGISIVDAYYVKRIPDDMGTPYDAICRIAALQKKSDIEITNYSLFTCGVGESAAPLGMDIKSVIDTIGFGVNLVEDAKAEGANVVITGENGPAAVNGARAISRSMSDDDNTDVFELLTKYGNEDMACMVGIFLGGVFNETAVVVDGYSPAIAARLAAKLDDRVLHAVLPTAAPGDPEHALDALYAALDVYYS